MKRGCEESDVEEMSAASEEKDKEEFCEEKVSARKKRRGLIEKRRRDRINGCLHELRHLVPKALEKQGSSKLEKAEILSLTVEHLRRLRHRSNDNQDDDMINTNYHEKGFYQCLSEVKCYISNLEGIQSKEAFSDHLANHLSLYKSSKKTPFGLTTNEIQHVSEDLPCSLTGVPQSIPIDKPRLFKTLYNQDSKPMHLVCTTGTILPQYVPHMNLVNSGQYVPIVSRSTLSTAVSSNEGPITLHGNQFLRSSLAHQGIDPLSCWPSVVMANSAANMAF